MNFKRGECFLMIKIIDQTNSQYSNELFFPPMFLKVLINPI
jgi:hypothetical protein